MEHTKLIKKEDFESIENMVLEKQENSVKLP